MVVAVVVVLRSVKRRPIALRTITETLVTMFCLCVVVGGDGGGVEISREEVYRIMEDNRDW